MWMQACSYLCGAFREINIWEHSVKWSSLNKSPWHNKHFWHMSTPLPTIPWCPAPSHTHTHKPHTPHTPHTLLSDTTYLSPPLLVLPNGASPQASKSNPSTNTVGIYLEWAFVLFNAWLLGWLGRMINSEQVVSVQWRRVCCPLYLTWIILPFKLHSFDHLHPEEIIAI